MNLSNLYASKCINSTFAIEIIRIINYYSSRFEKGCTH